MIGLYAHALWCRLGEGRLTAQVTRRVITSTLIAVIAWVLGAVSTAALASGRPRGWSSYGRSSAAAAAAQKSQMIQAIQNQVAAARQVLAVAESRAGMSQSQISAAEASIDDAKRTIDRLDSAGDSAASALKAIEDKLLNAIAPDSELGRAEAALEKQQEVLDRERHRIVTLPTHDGKLTAAD